MNNLIEKAIQAIKDNKQEYAIGLLEGVLEMSGAKPMDKVKVVVPVINPQITPTPASELPPVSHLETIKKLAEQGNV